jgi:hypothetical protein
MGVERQIVFVIKQKVIFIVKRYRKEGVRQLKRRQIDYRVSAKQSSCGTDD